MYNYRQRVFFAFILCLLSWSTIGQIDMAQTHLKFIENKGQWSSNIYYSADLPGGSLMVMNGKLHYQFYDQKKHNLLTQHNHNGDLPSDASVNYHGFNVNFVGGSIVGKPIIEGSHPFTENRNYFLGNDPAHWASNVTSFERITYQSVYDNIDLSIYQSGNSLKYEFIVKPHSSPKDITIQIEGADSVYLEQGHLLIETSVNGVAEKPPYAYQLYNDYIKEIPCEFILKNGVLTYKVGRYDKEKDLIIDPKLIFSTYSGSTADNWGNTACLDNEGNLYTGGTIFGTTGGRFPTPSLAGFPATTGAFQQIFQGGDTDIGILKFDSSGTNLIYATYIGGDGAEIPTSTIANDQQELFILGTSSSVNFPVSENAFQKQNNLGVPQYVWYVNGIPVDTGATTNLSGLNEGDSVYVKFLVQTSLVSCSDDTSTSNVITIDFPKGEYQVVQADTLICDGDTSYFEISLTDIFPDSDSIQWWLNGVDTGIRDSLFEGVNLQNGDSISVLIQYQNCDGSLVIDTVSFIVTHANGTSRNHNILSDKLPCTNTVLTLNLSSAENLENNSVAWYVNGLPRQNANTFQVELNNLDTVYAILTTASTLSCIPNDTLSDTLIIDNSLYSVTPEYKFLSFSDYNLCTGSAAVEMTVNYPGEDPEYVVSINNGPFILFTGGESFTQTGLTGNDSIVVGMVSQHGCRDKDTVFSKTIVFGPEDEKSPLVSIIATSDSSCEKGTASYSISGGAPWNESVVPVGGYQFTGGTDLVIIKLSADGSQVLGSTFIGGGANDGLTSNNSLLANNYGDQLRGDINIDSDDNVYITSTTSSVDFPVNGYQNSFGGGRHDAIVFKMNSNLDSLIWSSYFGGNGDETGVSIQRDSLNGVFFVGGTNSSNFKTTSSVVNESPIGHVDGYIAHFSPDGNSLIGSTLLGTPQFDASYFVQLGLNDNVFVLGQTKGNYPILGNVYENPNSGLFIHKLPPTLDSTFFSTVIGDLDSMNAIVPNISPTAFLVNECENLFISGWGGAVNATSPFSKNGGSTINMPLTSNAYDAITDGSDFYMMVLLKDADSLIYATYFGGQTAREHVDGGTSRFDRLGIVYQSVCAGCGANNDFPQFPTPDGDPNTYPQSNMSGNCNNGVFKFDLATLEAKFTNELECLPNTITFINLTEGGVDYLWKFGDDSTFFTLTTDSVSHTYLQPGTYEVTLIATDITTCIGKDSVTNTITIPEPFLAESFTDTICIGENLNLFASEDNTLFEYNWSPGTGVTDSTIHNPTSNTLTSTKFEILIKDTLGCEKTDTFNLYVLPELSADFEVIGTCPTELAELINTSNPASLMQWIINKDTITTNADTIRYTFNESGIKNIRVIAQNDSSCNIADTLNKSIIIYTKYIPEFFEATICYGDSLQVEINNGNGDFDYNWTPTTGVDLSDPSHPIFFPLSTQQYAVDFDNSINCFGEDSVIIKVNQLSDSISFGTVGSCTDKPRYEFRSLNNTAYNYSWNFGDNETSTGSSATHVYQKHGDFLVTVTISDTVCTIEDTITVKNEKFVVYNIFTPNFDNSNEHFQIDGINNNGNWKLDVYNRWGKLIFKDDRYKNDWKAAEIEDGTYYYLLTAPDESTCKGWVQILR